MNEHRHFYLLTLYVALAATAILFSSAFNIDKGKPTVHKGEREDFFGYKVLQYSSPNNKGVIITAPLRLNGSGGIAKFGQDGTEKWFSPKDSSEKKSHMAKHLGLSVTKDSSGSRFIACSPSLAHPCYENVFLNSLCYNITDEFQELSSFNSLFKECKEKKVNLVFLFDGSESMTGAEFDKNKDFIRGIMDNVKTNKSIKVAAAQFSTEFRTVFDFNDYVNGTALEKLEKEEQLMSLTNTHKALKLTLSSIFENQTAGASEDAAKAVVIITDGDPSDTDRNHKSVETYERKEIVRIVIGVKNVNLEKLRNIASKPKDKNALKIENYDGLTGLLENLQKQIFDIEGSIVTRSEKLTVEMSQSGFSAVSHKDTLILGSVGSNTWRGALSEPQKQDKLILDPEMQEASYMGYSLSVGERNGSPLYFTGAPRFDHVGQVIVFQPDDDKWNTTQRITGDQIGSYFGAELCSVDIDSDGNTDFLLVGAPMFYLSEERKEGIIYIYSLSDEMELTMEHQVRAPSMGRFGTTISSLSDLNGDGLRDVAVGAPLEQDNAGAVYIYLGQRGTGIRKRSSQRITGADFEPGLRFFGQSINGDIDLGDDGLPDIVVGSQGAAVVLRSKPILDVMADLSFYPNMISIVKTTCLEKGTILPMVIVKVCFEMVEVTQIEAEPRINISLMLNVDPMRQKHRGFFQDNERTSRNIMYTYELTGKETCFNYSIFMEVCRKDTLSPVIIKLNFLQAGSDDARAVLNVDSKKQAVIKVPFEKYCDKEFCIPDLKVDFKFRSKELLVRENNRFIILITLDNNGDHSYDTSLSIHYPPGLSFAKMEPTETNKVDQNCLPQETGVPNKTICGISSPVFLSKSSATFNATFHIAKDFEWNDTMSMTVTAESKNSNPNKTLSVTKVIPVKYSVRMAIALGDSSVSELKFTPENYEPQRMVIIYDIQNTGFKDFPISVSLFFPSKLEHNFEVQNYRVVVKPNKTACSVISTQKSENCPQGKDCVTMECNTFTLKNYSDVHFSLEGDVHYGNFNNYLSDMPILKRYTGVEGEVNFMSFIQIDYDSGRYVLDSPKHEKKNQTDNNKTKKKASVLVEFIVPPNRLVIIMTAAVLGFLLLIIIIIIMLKCGCFKRKNHIYYVTRR
ncbi:PREDICTED: integrin alpha-M-like [Cyprinodon variegatus]|uniref:integrin alpha-M-like n=1 Tax=Cyprinodon variegatus TaxID=28743 RepID=UPI000742A4A4|nr:PREDICTED: integrin alpha-M-like [Cyprinodon variegatus]